MLRLGLGRDLILYSRNKSSYLIPLLLYLIMAASFPMVLNIAAGDLQLGAGPVVWITAILAITLSLDPIWKDSRQDGTVNQLIISRCNLVPYFLGKVCAHILVVCIPIIMITPLVGLMFDLTGGEVLAVTLTMLCGLPILSMLGSLIAAMSIVANGSASLIVIMLFPLYTPIIILGASSILRSTQGLEYGGQLALLGAGLLLLGVVIPPTLAAILKLGN